jgi:hypothetical protein
VSDSSGNTYNVAIPTVRGTALSQAIYYAANIAGVAAGTNTVTVTFDTAVTYADIRILEYSGLDPANPFDVGTSSTGESSGWAGGNSVMTSSANELVIGAGMTLGAFTGAGPGFNSEIITSPDSDIVEDQTTTAIGLPATLAPVDDVWLMQMATFKAAGQ